MGEGQNSFVVRDGEIHILRNVDGGVEVCPPTPENLRVTCIVFKNQIMPAESQTMSQSLRRAHIVHLIRAASGVQHARLMTS